MGIFGTYNNDGSISEDADTCPITGRFVDKTNSVRERVPGTPHFYRIRQSVYEDVTDEQRAEVWAKAPTQPTQKATKAVTAEPLPAEEAATIVSIEHEKKGGK